MKFKILLPSLLLSFLAGGVVAFIHQAGRQIGDTGPRLQPKPKVENGLVLLARHKLGAGWLLNEPERFFERLVPEKAIRDFEALKGKRLKKTMIEGMIVTTDDVSDRNEPLNDLKEVTLPVRYDNIWLEHEGSLRRSDDWTMPENVRFGRKIFPGSHVDIVSEATSGDGESDAKLVVLDAIVLKIDDPNRFPERDGSYIHGMHVTVQAKWDRARWLDLVQEIGGKVKLYPVSVEDLARRKMRRDLLNRQP